MTNSEPSHNAAPSGTVRVLVVLDPASPRSEVLEAISSLTGGRSARLTGLFVEDSELFSLARLPFAREIRPGGGPAVALDPEGLARAFESQAERVRRLFERTAAALRLGSSFHVVRGNVLDELVQAARDADLLLIGRAGREAGPRNWRSDLVGRLPRSTRKTVVYVQERWRSGQTVVVYHDGDEESRETLELAVRIATLERAPLTVLIPGRTIAGEGTPIELRERVEQELGDLEAHARLEVVDPLGSMESLDSWRRLLKREDARALVLPAGHPEVDDRLLAALLDRLDCSLVVVSQPDAEAPVSPV